MTPVRPNPPDPVPVMAMHSDRQRLIVWSIPVATLLIFLLLSWNQRPMRGDAQEPREPLAEVQAILLEALEIAHRIPYAFERDRVLLGIAVGLAQTGETEAALRVAMTVTRSPLREQAFFMAVHALVRDGRADEAGELLSRIRQPELHMGAAALVISARFRAGKPEAALRLYEGMPPSRDRRRLWEYVAAHRPGADAIGPVLRMIDGLVEEEERDWALAGIARGLARHGRIRRAVEITERISTEAARAYAQWGVVSGQARSGDLGGALLTATDLPPQGEAKTAAVSEIAKAYVALGDVEGALGMADMVDAAERACVLRAVAVQQATSGAGEAGFKTSQRIAAAGERSRAQIEVARAQVQHGDVVGALRVAGAIREEALRSRMLVEVALAQAEAGVIDGAQRTMGRLEELHGMKATVYSEIAAARAREGAPEAAAAVADQFERPSERAVVLLGAARGGLERARKIEVPGPEVACGFRPRTVDLLLRPVDIERLVAGRYALS